MKAALAALLLCACHVYREPCAPPTESPAGGVTVRWCWATDDDADAGSCR